MQVAPSGGQILAWEITQVKEAMPWVRCASGNVFRNVINSRQKWYKRFICHLVNFICHLVNFQHEDFIGKETSRHIDRGHTVVILVDGIEWSGRKCLLSLKFFSFSLFGNISQFPLPLDHKSLYEMFHFLFVKTPFPLYCITFHFSPSPLSWYFTFKCWNFWPKCPVIPTSCQIIQFSHS